MQVWMDGRVEGRVMRRSGGGREIAELEVWMDGRVEGRVLRRSGGGREVAEVEVWMDGRMECVVQPGCIEAKSLEVEEAARGWS